MGCVKVYETNMPIRTAAAFAVDFQASASNNCLDSYAAGFRVHRNAPDASAGLG
jgi:hypothetical protein